MIQKVIKITNKFVTNKHFRLFILLQNKESYKIEKKSENIDN